MKKLVYKLTALTVLIGLVIGGCRNPAYDINVLFDAAVIQYKATLILKEATGAALPANITATITGTDAASIYDFSGTKAVPVVNGIITLGVTPKDIPTSAKTLSFNVVITAPNYDTKIIPVTIALNQFGQIINVTMLKTVVPSPASSVVTTEIPLSPTGASTAVATFATPSTGNVPQQTSITVPAGVTFKDASGATLTGGSVTAQAVNFDASDPVALALFPGGDLSATNVTLPNGQTGNAFFFPAGFTNIEMFVGGVQVRNFSTPITVGMQLDETFKPQATGAALKVGDQIGIYSYNGSAFKFETNANVLRDAAGKLAVSFQTNHLTVFIAGDVVATAACKVPSVTYSAAWMGTASTPLTVQILAADGIKVLDTRTVLISDGLKDVFSGLPPVAVKYKVINPATGATLAEGAIADPCAGTDFTITVGAPGGAPVVSVSLVLGVTCPGKGVISVPDFDMFYRPAGSNAAFSLLGTAKKGQIRTTLLTVGQSYDFRANWGTQTKQVNNRLISNTDLSTTVGDGIYLGDKNPTANKALLIEACKSF